MTREAVAVAQWHARLSMARNRCLYEAEQSLEAAAHYGQINRPCQQKDARIYVQRCQDALLAVESIDRLTEPQPRRAVPESVPRRALPEAEPRRQWVTV